MFQLTFIVINDNDIGEQALKDLEKAGEATE